jgi:DNA-binding transcriptional regulator YdaS (Cro superfamily)
MAIEEAISSFGSATKLAKFLGITVSNISQWKKKGKWPLAQQEKVKQFLEQK